MEWVVLAAAFMLAFVNGANDNFKPVATLYGSKSLSYRQSLLLATVTTALGSLLSLALAAGLVHAFSGKGLIPDALLDAPLLASVGLGAATTVLLATRLGFPVSTTHALVGGIGGAGFVAAGSSLELGALGRAFLLPLMVAPLLAVALAWLGLRTARGASHQLGIESQTCVCVGRTTAAASSADRVIDWGHLLSASSVGFARGLNDTPKILGLLMGAALLTPIQGTLAIAAAMALGGIVAARRVAETLSTKITPMTSGQGLVGNLATSALVIGASRLGLPVSTTHVSTGAIFGIGGAEGSLRWGAVGRIVSAWITTLPLAAVLAATLMWGQRWL